MTGKCKLTNARVLFVFDLFCSLPRIFKFRVLCGGIGVGVGSSSKPVYLIIIIANYVSLPLSGHPNVVFQNILLVKHPAHIITYTM